MVEPGQIRHFRYRLIAQSYESPRFIAPITPPFIIDIPADSPACAVFDNPKFQRTELYLPKRKSYTTSLFMPKLKQQIDDYEEQVAERAVMEKQAEAERQAELEKLRKQKEKQGGNPDNGGAGGKGDGKDKGEELPEEIEEHPVTALGLHPDTMKVVKTQFAKVGDLMAITDEDLLKITGIGDARAKEIRKAVEAYLMKVDADNGGAGG